MSRPTANIDIAELKRAAHGRWAEILVHFGFHQDLLDGQHHPCPKCHGVDRFRYFDAPLGACICNQCFKSRNGDGIAAVAWLNGWNFGETVNQIGAYLGLTAAPREHENLVTKIARLKHVPLASWKAYGACEEHRQNLLVCRVPMFDQHRQPCSYQDYSDLDAKFLKGMSAKGLPAGLFVASDEWPEFGDDVFLVEGCKDAAALREFLIRHKLPGKVVGLPTSKLGRKFATVFEDCNVFLVPDLDEAGEAGSNQTASRLYRLARCVKIVRLPGEFSSTNGEGVREVLAKSEGEQQLLAAVAEARVWSPQQVEDAAGNIDSKPHIFCSLDERTTNDRIIQALGREKALFQRGGSLVRMIHEAEVASGIKRPAMAPSIQLMPEASVRELISKNVVLQERRGGEIVNIRVPHHVSKAIHQRGEWAGIRKLESVVSFPIIRADGSVAATPGFDARTGLYLDVPRNLVVLPENPTLEHARGALRMLGDLVSDFPFEKPAHRSAWFAYLLTPLARYAFHGPAPLFMVDANTRGSGKTLISEIGSQIVTGADFARLAPTRDDEEMRKRITSIALRGDPLVLLDNVVGELGTASLDSALTGTTWTDRILGQSHQVTIPLYATWVATGNNIILAADTTRRVCHIRLSSPDEHPEDRANFQHADILSHVRQNRSALLSAALTVLAAYFRANCPTPPVKPWGSFEGWSSVVRGALVWAGEPDPADTREELMAISDNGTNQLIDLIAGWELADPDRQGMTAAQAVRKLDDFYCPDPLKDAIHSVCGTSPARPPSGGSFGKHMVKFRGRVVGGKCFDYRLNGDKVKVWRVIKAGDVGDNGDILTTPRDENSNV